MPFLRLTKLLLLLPHFLMGVGYFPPTLCAQNLVPNPGFEDMLRPSTGYATFEDVAHWYNPCQEPDQSRLYGTPDHLYIPDNASFQQYRTSFAPHQGRAAAGIITYMQRVPNFREYIGVPLDEPLKVGKKYRIELWVSSGDQTSFGKMGTNGLAFWLSKEPLRQRAHEPIGQMPVYVHTDIIFHMGYRPIAFEFTAAEASKHLTLGNALPDRSLKKKYFGLDLDPQAYLYIDEVLLWEVGATAAHTASKTEEAPSTDTIDHGAGAEDPQLEPKADSLLNRRNVSVKRTYKVSREKMVVRIWDDRTLDGDIVSLIFNGEVVLDHYELRRRKKRVLLHYDPERENVLVLHAHNLGDEPPNTAALTVKAGKKKWHLRLQSDLEGSGAVRFVR